MAMTRLGKINKFTARHDRNLRSKKSPFKEQDEQLKRDQAKLKDLDLEFREVGLGGANYQAAYQRTPGLIG
jgi:hypothetical protein